MCGFEELMVKICADHRIWLRDHVVFRNGTYGPINHHNEWHCQHASYFGLALIVWNHQQARIDELEKQLKRSMIAIEDGEIDWALRNIKRALRGEK